MRHKRYFINQNIYFGRNSLKGKTAIPGRSQLPVGISALDRTFTRTVNIRQKIGICCSLERSEYLLEQLPHREGKDFFKYYLRRKSLVARLFEHTCGIK